MATANARHTSNEDKCQSNNRLLVVAFVCI